MKRWLVIVLIIVGGWIIGGLFAFLINPPRISKKAEESTAVVNNLSSQVIITEIEKERDKEGKIFCITINDFLVIRDVELVSKLGKTELKMPVYVSYTGQVYDQIRFIDPRTEEAVKEQVIEGKASREGLPPVSFQIYGFYPLSNSKSHRLVNVEVMFSSAVIVSCGIMKSKKEDKTPWISWPGFSDKKTKRWIKQVWIKDVKIKDKIEDELLAHYRRIKGQ